MGPNFFGPKLPGAGLSQAVRLLMREIEVAVLRRLLMRAHVRAGSAVRPPVLPGDLIGTHILADGCYERPELTAVLALLKARGALHGWCLDIGANIGNHTLFLAPHLAGVIAVEPDQRARAFLELGVAQLPPGRVSIVPLGFDDSAGDNPIGREGDSNLGAVSMHGAARGAAGYATVPVVRGDDYIRDHFPDLAPGGRNRIAFVKCDVEGLEPRVFRGLTKTLTLHQPLVMFESLSPGLGNEAMEVLRQCGYRHFARLNGPLQQPGLSRIGYVLRHGDTVLLEAETTAPGHSANLIAACDPLPPSA